MATQFAGNTADTLYERNIKYDRTTRDYCAQLNGELVGYFPCYQAAEDALNEIVFEELATCASNAAASCASSAQEAHWTGYVYPDARCEECDGEGVTPCFDGCGDASGGWANVCQVCNGKGVTL